MKCGKCRDEKAFGFVCPDWARKVWSPDDCTIEPTTDGTSVVLDHSSQTVVYAGHTVEECADWLGFHEALLVLRGEDE